jgi:hypothetical protein
MDTASSLVSTLKRPSEAMRRKVSPPQRWVQETYKMGVSHKFDKNGTD